MALPVRDLDGAGALPVPSGPSALGAREEAAEDRAVRSDRRSAMSRTSRVLWMVVGGIVGGYVG
jgi:hypothetical protein